MIAVDNLVNGKRENLAGVAGDLCFEQQADIRDAARIETGRRGHAWLFSAFIVVVPIGSVRSPRRLGTGAILCWKQPDK